MNLKPEQAKALITQNIELVAACHKHNRHLLAMLPPSEAGKTACPFCGESDSLEMQGLGFVHAARIYSVHCRNCGGEGPAAESKQEAKQLWDKRG